MKQLVILAGGKGTRLRERLGNLPKPLIDVCGVPLLERQILLAKRYGFERVLILVNYQAETIVEFCRSKNNWDLDIQCIDDGEPCGTAGAVLQALDYLEDEFLLMYGDTMLEVDLQRFYQYHIAVSRVSATLFLHPNDHPQDSDLVEIDDQGYVAGFHPYPHDTTSYYPNLVNAALYWIDKTALEPWRGFSGGILDFGKHLFPEMIAKGNKLRGYNSPEYIKDCGTPSRIDRVCNDFLSGKISRATLDHKQMAIFLDRDGTINREVNHLRSEEQLELLPHAGEAIRRFNRSEYRVCVVTNQPVIARGECTQGGLKQIHNKLETILGQEGAFLDRIYFCPHHPDKGFPDEIVELKIECKCRKPETGMIDLAVSELNISRKYSWMIGDSTSDILAANRAGLKSILVETGYAGLDSKHCAIPDFIVPDLNSAATFILETYPALKKSITNLIQNVPPGEICFIGGQSRSGKSTYASVMRDALEDQGKRCHLISTDRWLLDVTDRGPGILKRHSEKKLYELINQLTHINTRPERIQLPGYIKATRSNIPDAEFIELSTNDVIIVEGVLSLHFAKLFNGKFQYFVDIDEDIRKQRVIREYLLRGYSQGNAEDIYSSRLAEEVPWIELSGSNAVHLPNPTDFKKP
jgi:histidinol-phosphate phosphatase family protein